MADEVDAREAGLLLVHYESISPVLVKRGSRQCPWRLEGALSDRLRLEGWWLPLSLSFLLIKVHTMGGPLADGWQWLSPGFLARPRVTPGLAWQLLSSAAFTNFQVPGKVDCYSLAFQTLSVGSKKNIWINIMPHLLYSFVICILFCSKVLCFHCVFPWKIEQFCYNQEHLRKKGEITKNCKKATERFLGNKIESTQYDCGQT